MDAHIGTFTMNIKDLTSQQIIGTITYDGSTVASTYVETDPLYTTLGLKGRVNIIGILSVTQYSKSIQVVFKNINDNNGLMNQHPIEIGLIGTVHSTI